MNRQVAAGLIAFSVLQFPHAQAVSFGHTGGGGGGGGGRSFSGGGGGGRSFSGGGGGFSRSYSAPSRGGGYYSAGGAPGAGYRAIYNGEGPLYTQGAGPNDLPTDWMPAIYGGNTSPRVLPTMPPPFALPDPLAEFYKQQELNSQMAQQTATTQVGVMPLPQTHLPTDFGSSVGRRDGVVTVEQGTLVRNNFHGSGLFTKAWWKNYKNAWYNPVWTDDWVWNAVDWDTLVAFWRGTAPKSPAEYEFDSTIVFNDGKVFYGGEPLMSLPDYYQQGEVLATKGEHHSSQKKGNSPHKVPLVKDWAQLGVFSLVPASEKFSTKIIQLAVNRDGKVRGNCYDVMNDQLDRVEGEIDKTNSRVCFTVGKNRAVLYDTGLGNLLSAQSPIVIHLDKDRVQQRALVRLAQSKL